MDSGGQKKMPSSLPVMAVLTIIGGAFLISRSPLKSSRPEAPAGLREPVADMDKIDARLWQDPLKVAFDHEKTMRDERKARDSNSIPKCSSEHSVNQVTRRIIEQTDPNGPNTIVHVLLTIIRDGTFAEDHERRLRNRYAVLGALHSFGLAPEDTEHIRYFRLPWPTRNELERKTLENQLSIMNEAMSRMSEPQIFPFEWFEGGFRDGRAESVLVVWLSESAFSHRPLTRLEQIIAALGHSDCNNLIIDLIGPSYSGTLRTMLGEITDVLGPSNSTTLEEKLEQIEAEIGEIKEQSNNAPNAVHVCLKPKDREKAERMVKLEQLRGRLEKLKKLSGIRIYSPWATASPALLVKDWPDQDANQNSMSKMYEVIPKEFYRIDVNFVRMIGSDDLLAMELINELGRRDIDVFPEPDGDPDHVALICEWDTFYGEAFPLTFAAMMESIEGTGSNSRRLEPDWAEYAKKLREKKSNRKGCFPQNLRTYSYIRGIDGVLPESEASKETQANKDTESKSKWIYAKSLELPIGRGQLGYVRRLVQELSDEYKRPGHNKLKAIGVVGSDVYDKLILLHALREQFGDVILFMTDLDARLIHHERFKWTRNVIVASNFGLKLNDKYQRGVYEEAESSLPPFRDNYQTVLFFACRTALGASESTGLLFGEVNEQGLAEVLAHPRLFEIGRGRAVDLSVDDVDIHPPRRNWP